MTAADLEKMMEEAANRGANRALERVGLHDESAGRDIQEIRTLLSSWRSVKSEALKSVTGMLTKTLLVALLIGLSVKTGIWDHF